jgi:hypothetical protein
VEWKGKDSTAAARESKAVWPTSTERSYSILVGHAFGDRHVEHGNEQAISICCRNCCPRRGSVVEWRQALGSGTYLIVSG